MPATAQRLQPHLLQRVEVAAESTFVILLAILTASLLLLPGQGRTAVGAEMFFIGAVLVYRTARTWPVPRAGLTGIEEVRGRHGE